MRRETEVIAIQTPGSLGRVDLVEEVDISQHGRLVLGQEGACPVGAVVDPGDATGLRNFIAAVSLDPVVSDFSALPLDLVSEVIELVAAIEPEQGVVVVGSAQDRIFGEDRREGKLGLFGRAVEMDEPAFDACGDLIQVELHRREVGAPGPDASEGVDQASLGGGENIGQFQVDAAAGRHGDSFTS